MMHDGHTGIVDRNHRLWFWACGFVGALLACRVGLQFVTADWQSLACDIVSLARGGLCVGMLVWAARVASRASGGWHPAWVLLALGALAWTIADVIWLMLNLLGTQPWASAADLFYLVSYPLFLAGGLSLPRRFRSVGGAWAAFLDVAAIIAASAAVLWTLVVGPSFSEISQPSAMTVVIALAYPVGDLLLLWVSLDLLFRGRIRAPFGVAPLLAGGALALASADIVYAVQIMHGTYANGNPLGMVWTLAMGLIALAGARQATGLAVDEPPPSLVLNARMTTAVLAAVAMLVTWGLLIALPTNAVAQAAAVTSVILILLRQIQAQHANGILEDRLQALNGDLEERVRLRTAELAQTQLLLAEAQRLEAVGRVAGAVAHDFNNILTAVGGHADLAATKTQDPELIEHLARISGAVARAAELSRRLITSSRPQALVVRPTDVGAIAAEVLGQVACSLPPGVHVDLKAPPAGTNITADGGQLHQVLMNLCVNARDAMPIEGILGVCVTASPGWVEVVVSDSGCGMDADVRARLFEPYFTTKGAGRGTGLGLATVRSIVRQHGGTIAVESSPGRGSTFTVRLPANGPVAG